MTHPSPETINYLKALEDNIEADLTSAESELVIAGAIYVVAAKKVHDLKILAVLQSFKEKQK